MPEVRILIADDHEIVRRGLCKLIADQPGWNVVGEARNGREAVEKAATLRPEIVILDIAMPILNGLEATKQILKNDLRTKILILTMHESDQMIRQILAAGARGYVLKSDAGRDLVTAIETLR